MPRRITSPAFRPAFSAGAFSVTLESFGAIVPHAFVELHIEQGPVMEAEGVEIGAVENLQGISWQEFVITGQSNHAGTTPMHLRRDAGYAAAAIVVFVRELAQRYGGGQVATVGALNLHPNLINVIAARASVTVDLRNTDEATLQRAERELAAFVARLAQEQQSALLHREELGQAGNGDIAQRAHRTARPLAEQRVGAVFQQPDAPAVAPGPQRPQVEVSVIGEGSRRGAPDPSP